MTTNQNDTPNNPKPKFPSRESYLEWCAEQCQKIKTSCIAMNNDGIKEVVFEIDRKLYLTDYQELHAEQQLEIEYTGHVPCLKCGMTHWMHGPCPSKPNDQGHRPATETK